MKFEIEFIKSHLEATSGTVEIEAENETDARDLFSGGDYKDETVVWERTKQFDYSTQIEDIKEVED